ncbi:hypothetical protein CPLU01_08161 [Colletotrichum plurivorum]|uniref:Uncharacterized protein n=1 Tax=Colletotrichum plurivorum TaxID=2175906 RepID=A0A8H6KCR6_9PEZI|nr:hypothetical protein CPLU01_08161 [Colletotrichum plurivorum]
MLRLNLPAPCPGLKKLAVTCITINLLKFASSLVALPIKEAIIRTYTKGLRDKPIPQHRRCCLSLGVEQEPHRTAPTSPSRPLDEDGGWRAEEVDSVSLPVAERIERATHEALMGWASWLLQKGPRTASRCIFIFPVPTSTKPQATDDTQDEKQDYSLSTARLPRCIVQTQAAKQRSSSSSQLGKLSSDISGDKAPLLGVRDAERFQTRVQIPRRHPWPCASSAPGPSPSLIPA